MFKQQTIEQNYTHIRSFSVVQYARKILHVLGHLEMSVFTYWLQINIPIEIVINTDIPMIF